MPKLRLNPVPNCIAVTAALLALLVCPGATFAAVSQDEARRVLTLLSAVGEEYREGVRDGAVSRPIELEEASAFLQDALSGWRKLSPQIPDNDLTQLFADTAAAITAKAPSDDVATKLTALRQRVTNATGVSEEIYPPNTPSSARGKVLFSQYCASCHGEQGDGKGPSAARLKPPPADFTDPQFMRGETPYDFYHVISLGKRNTAMPAWDQSLSVQDRWDIVSYVWTLTLGEGGTAEAQGVYLAHCANCHGATGDGRAVFTNILLKQAPDLSQPKALARRTDTELFTATSDGIAGSPMPSFARTLAEDERWKAVAFLRLLSLGGVEVKAASAGTDSGQPHVQPSAVETALVESARLLDASVLAYSRGETQAPATAADAYMQFEPIEKRLAAVAPGVTERTEEHFLHLRQLLRAPGNEAEIESLSQTIHQDLADVRIALEPRTSPYALFVESATIILREGLEIVLVVGALIAYVMKTRNRTLQRSIYAGVGAGIAASCVTAFVLSELVHIYPAASDILEGMTMLLAAVVLFWVSYWLISKSEAAKWQRYIHDRVQTAVTAKRSFALAGAAFLAVYREGFEIVLFYQALYASAPAASMTVTAGFVAGTIALLVVYFIFRRFEIRIPIRQFFFVTGLFLYAMAAVFAGQGIHELQDAAWVPVTPVTGVPMIPLLGIFPSAESLCVQALFLALLVYATAVAARRRRGLAAGEPDDGVVVAELRALRGAVEALHQELIALRASGSGQAGTAERVEGTLLRVERLVGRVGTGRPMGRANGEGQYKRS